MWLFGGIFKACPDVTPLSLAKEGVAYGREKNANSRC